MKHPLRKALQFHIKKNLKKTQHLCKFQVAKDLECEEQGGKKVKGEVLTKLLTLYLLREIIGSFK